MASLESPSSPALYIDEDVTEQFRRDQFNEFLQLVLKFLETHSRDELRDRVFYLSQLGA